MFWRNEDWSNFAAPGADARFDHWYGEIRNSGNRLLGDAVADFLSLLRHGRGDNARWLPQELAFVGNTASASLVREGVEARVVGATVGAGVSFYAESGDRGLHGEVGGYLHRLVCTNGMISVSEARGRIAAETANSWSRQLSLVLPPLLSDLGAGIEVLKAASRVDLGPERSSLARLLAGWSMDGQTRAHVTRAFDMEPGGSLADLANALARAANLAIDGQSSPDLKTLQSRRILQKASLQVCESNANDHTHSGSPFRVPDACRLMVRITAESANGAPVVAQRPWRG